MKYPLIIKMLTPPELLWRTEPGSLYTVLLVNTDIEDSLQVHSSPMVDTDLKDSLQVHSSPPSSIQLLEDSQYI